MRGGGDIGDYGVKERGSKKSLKKNREGEKRGKKTRVVWLLKLKNRFARLRNVRSRFAYF